MSAATAYASVNETSFNTVVRVDSSLNAAGKTRLIDLLEGAGYLKLAASVQRCHSEYRVLSCANGHQFKPVPTYRCNYRLCPDCARSRQRRAFARLMPVLHAHQRRYRFDRPVLITLTAKSSFEPLAVLDRRFKSWFARLRRTVGWRRHIRGAVAGFEFTRHAEKGWHYHIHILAFRKSYGWYEHSELLKQWQRITDNAGCVVDIQSKGTLQTMAEEVLKYCVKPADITGNAKPEKQWQAQQVAEFNQLRRVKLSESYGSLRGFELDEKDKAAEAAQAAQTVDEHEYLSFGSPCPDCGLRLQYATVPRALVTALCDSS